jgi:hypothetical protein
LVQTRRAKINIAKIKHNRKPHTNL